VQELFDRLAAALTAGGPDSTEVKNVLQQFDQQFPAQSAAARAIVATDSSLAN
jgi:hypothetical protein